LFDTPCRTHHESRPSHLNRYSRVRCSPRKFAQRTVMSCTVILKCTQHSNGAGCGVMKIVVVWEATALNRLQNSTRDGTCWKCALQRTECAELHARPLQIYHTERDCKCVFRVGSIWNAPNCVPDLCSCNTHSPGGDCKLWRATRCLQRSSVYHDTQDRLT